MTLRAAFIGAGNRSQRAHYPNVARLDDVEMAAVCELDEGRLDQVVDKYGFQQVYTNHEEMLAEANPDIVYCIMNEQWLLQPALDCLNAGKHIFIEKPPGANPQETQQLLDAAVANNVFAMVGYQRRFTAVTPRGYAAGDGQGAGFDGGGDLQQTTAGRCRRRLHDDPLERCNSHCRFGPLHGRR